MENLIKSLMSTIEKFLYDNFYNKEYDNYIKIFGKVIGIEKDSRRFLNFQFGVNWPSSNRYRSGFGYRVIAEYIDQKTKKKKKINSDYFDICRYERLSYIVNTPLGQTGKGKMKIEDIVNIGDKIKISVNPKDYSKASIDISQFLKKE